LDRVLFLDADLLVLDDLSKLWNVNLGTSVLGAVADAAVPTCCAPRGVKAWREREIPPDTPYFNGGVLLISLARWRELRITELACEYFQTAAGPLDYLHQEALNAVLPGRWHQLSRRWNLLASLDGRKHYRQEIGAWKDPGIVHFAGRMKPWLAPIGGPFDALYRAELHQLRAPSPLPRATTRHHLFSLYDRYLRTGMYPLEHWLWKERYL
jgi:lipopolysaccharide biosynthesis glycosyltransferase